MRGGNSNIFVIFTPKIGEDEPNLTIIFFRWVVQPPTSGGIFGAFLEKMVCYSQTPRAPHLGYDDHFSGPRSSE